MTHLIKVRDFYYYNRRVPERVRALDPRALIRISLFTDCKATARKKAESLNRSLEEYWSELAKTDTRHNDRKYRQMVRTARDFGFTYEPMSSVALAPLVELIERLLAAKDATPKQVEAIIGKPDTDAYPLSVVLDKFWSVTENRLYNKSADQIRKWKNPRKRAIANLIKVISDKDVRQITRDDMLKFQKWWIKRMNKNELTIDAPNKDFINVKNIIETVSEHCKLNLDIQSVFRKLILKERIPRTRPPFETAQILAILSDKRLNNLNREARFALFACADTGARPSEIVGLLPEDIHLNHEVPYISIKDRRFRELKTGNSNRDIPLVGYALLAFKEMPEGFSSYRDVPDNLTNAINKFLNENDMLPTDKHSMYSLRHSFQDRLTELDAPDRIQTQLMGHKFNRAKYGKGGSLELLHSWMLRVCLQQHRQVTR